MVVLLVLWGMVSGDECGDDIDDGRGVKVETAELLLWLENGLGGGVGRGRAGGALLRRRGRAGGAGGRLAGVGVGVGVGDVVVEDALEVEEGAELWGGGDDGAGRSGGASTRGGVEGDAAVEAGAGGISVLRGRDVGGAGSVHGGWGRREVLLRGEELHRTGGEHYGGPSTRWATRSNSNPSSLPNRDPGPTGA